MLLGGNVCAFVNFLLANGEWLVLHLYVWCGCAGLLDLCYVKFSGLLVKGIMQWYLNLKKTRTAFAIGILWASDAFDL